MKDMSYSTNSKEERNAILYFLISQRYKWHGEEGYHVDKIEEEYPYTQFPILNIRTNGEISGSVSNGVYPHVEIKEIFSLPKAEFLSLDYKGYNVVVSKDSVKFGCQTLPKEFVKDLEKKLTTRILDTKTPEGEYVEFRVDGLSFDGHVYNYNDILDLINRVNKFWNEQE